MWATTGFLGTLSLLPKVRGPDEGLSPDAAAHVGSVPLGSVPSLFCALVSASHPMGFSVVFGVAGGTV